MCVVGLLDCNIAAVILIWIRIPVAESGIDAHLQPQVLRSVCDAIPDAHDHTYTQVYEVPMTDDGLNPSQDSVSRTAVVYKVTTTANLHELGPSSAVVICPHCKTMDRTKTSTRSGNVNQ